MFIQLQVMSRGEMFDEGDMISHLWNVILICSFGDCSCQKEKNRKAEKIKSLFEENYGNVYLIQVLKKIWLLHFFLFY